MKKPGFLAGMVALPLLALYGCGGAAEPQAAAPAADGKTTDVFVAKDAKGIRTMTVQAQAVPEYLEIPGRVTPDPTLVVHVYPTAGGRVTEMKVRPWDRVEKGETLALLESSDVSRAVADYEKARTDSEIKKKELDRATDLFNHHAISQREFDQAQADDAMSKEEERATLDALHLLGVDPAAGANQLRVVSPRSGIVLDTGAASGEMSKSLDAPQPLCTIADLSTVWVEGQVFEKDLAGAEDWRGRRSNNQRLSRRKMAGPRVGRLRSGGPEHAHARSARGAGQSRHAAEAGHVCHSAPAAIFRPRHSDSRHGDCAGRRDDLRIRRQRRRQI